MDPEPIPGTWGGRRHSRRGKSTWVHSRASNTLIHIQGLIKHSQSTFICAVWLVVKDQRTWRKSMKKQGELVNLRIDHSPSLICGPWLCHHAAQYNIQHVNGLQAIRLSSTYSGGLWVLCKSHCIPYSEEELGKPVIAIRHASTL